MKLDTLVGMAKETAAFGVHPSGEYIYSFYTEQLQAFAKLVAEHEREKLIDAAMKAAEKGIDTALTLEREACAGLRKEVELKGKCSTEYEEGFWEGLARYEDLIRARGQA
jgi:methanogenic corrinoid protein MtbC1